MQLEIDPTIRKGLRYIPPYPLNKYTLPVVRALLPFFVRKTRLKSVRIEDFNIGNIKGCVYRPQGARDHAVLMWIHGGGLILGKPSNVDARCSDLAIELGINVFAPKYRLAPEHPFPAALDDCYAAWKALAADKGDLRAVIGTPKPSVLWIGGESAGGGLAAATVQRLQAENGRQADAQILVYPMLDVHTAYDTELDALHHPIWNNAMNRLGWRSYLDEHFQSDRFQNEYPRFSVPALCEDLRGLPPTWIGVGTADLFSEEDQRYAERLRKAGVHCHLEVVPGAYHGFDEFAPKSTLARNFLRSQVDFLQDNVRSAKKHS